ncbi:hypothetical protein TWF594_010133 [Orbilia oligospora]|nr:hypothetical protein TWF706_000944 [Orbilia oligospora]KAF3131059.1 hypothetical protein TWF594_010133 [Orbilia oligospora]
MLSSKLILTAFLFSTASIAQLPSLKISNPKVATSPSSCTNKNAENATKLNLPPFIDVSNSEPNAASKPGSQPLSNQYGGGGARKSSKLQNLHKSSELPRRTVSALRPYFHPVNQAFSTWYHNHPSQVAQPTLASIAAKNVDKVGSVQPLNTPCWDFPRNTNFLCAEGDPLPQKRLGYLALGVYRQKQWITRLRRPETEVGGVELPMKERRNIPERFAVGMKWRFLAGAQDLLERGGCFRGSRVEELPRRAALVFLLDEEVSVPSLRKGAWVLRLDVTTNVATC